MFSRHHDGLDFMYHIINGDNDNDKDLQRNKNNQGK